MPRAEIATKQAVYTLGLLHAELEGKLLANKRGVIRLRTAMMQIEAVTEMLNPAVNIRLIAAKRRNVGNTPDNVVVNADLGTARAGEVFPSLIGASAIQRVRLLTVDALHFEPLMQIIPSAALVGIHDGPLDYASADE